MPVVPEADEAKAACVEAFLEACDLGVGLTDNAARDAIDKVLDLTVLSAVKTNPEYWTKPLSRHFFLRHARLIGRVACGYARAGGSSVLKAKDIMDAADHVVWRAQVICKEAPGPGCAKYIEERPQEA